MIAREIMTRDVVTVKRSTPVPEIAKIMASNGISGLPVTDDGDCLVGMVSEEDLLLKHDKVKAPHRLALFGLWVVPDESVVNAYKSARGGTTAEDVMTTDVITFEEEDNVDRIARVMVERQINRVPILRGGRLVGIVTRADILKSIAGEQV